MSLFTKVPMKRPPSNTFNLSHEWKGTIEMKRLYPVLCMEAVPADVIRLQSTTMSRFLPLVAPIMHAVSIYTHTFFVPNRLVWDNWEDFITGGENGTDAPVFPTVTLNDTQYALNPLMDSLGLPNPLGS